MKPLYLFLCLVLLSYTIPASAAETEPNNTSGQANLFNLNASQNGLMDSSDVDWFYLTTTSDGRLSVIFSSVSSATLGIVLYKGDATTVLTSYVTSQNTTLYAILTPGTYYIKVYPYYNDYRSTGYYSLASQFDAVSETEPNGTSAQANILPLNGGRTGWAYGGDPDYWKITTNADGNLSVTLTPNLDYISLSILDADGVTLLGQNYSNGTFTVTVNGLAKGVYYAEVHHYYSDHATSYSINNTLAVPAEANDVEPNGSRTNALILPLNGSKTGHIGYYNNNKRDSADWYKVTTNADGRLRLQLNPVNGQYVWMTLLDNNGVILLKNQYSNGPHQFDVDGLAKGTYYIKINCFYDNGFSPYVLSDSLFKADYANDAEPNNLPTEALSLGIDSTTRGHIGYYYNNKRDMEDWYWLTTPKDGRLLLKFNQTNGQYVYMTLYDADKTTVLGQQYSNNPFSFNTDGLAKGKYYVKINCFYSDGFAPYALTDSFYTPTEVNDVEPNTASSPITLGLNQSTTGHIGYYYDHVRDSVDYYSLTTNADGRIFLKLNPANGENVWVTLFDHDMTTVLVQGYSNGTFNISKDGLAAGTYYVKVNCFYSNGFAPYTLTDSLFVPAEPNDVEPNDVTPFTLGLNKTVKGHVGYYYNHYRDSADLYKLVTNADGRLFLKLKPVNGQHVWVQLYDANKTSLIAQNYSNNEFSIQADGMAAGTYYVRVVCYYINDGFTPYVLTDSLYVPTQANDTEPNNRKNSAITMNVNSSVTGHIGYFNNQKRDSTDWYKLVLPNDGMLQLSLNPVNGQLVWVTLFDNDGTTVLNSTYSGTPFTMNTDGLAAGTYFVRINCYYSTGFAPYELTNNLVRYKFDSETGNNDKAAFAKAIPENGSSDGHVGFYYNTKRDPMDWWKFTYPGTGAMTFVLALENWKSNGGIPYTYFTVYTDTLQAPIYSNYFNSAATVININPSGGTTYYIKINTYYANDFSAYRIYEYSKAQPKPAIVNTGNTVSQHCLNGNTLSYKVSGGAKPYVIQLYRYGSSYGNAVYVNDTLPFTISNLPHGIFYASVRNAVSADTANSKAVTLMPVPQNLTSKNITSTKATVKWTPYPCMKFFRVQYRKQGTTTWTVKTTKGSTDSVNLLNLTANSTYEFRVQAVDSVPGQVATGAYSGIATFMTSMSVAADYASARVAPAVGEEKESHLEVYPNPATNYVRIVKGKGEIVSVTLINSSGQVVYTSGRQLSSMVDVDVSNLTAGVYVVKITDSDGKVSTKRVLVKGR